MIREAVIKCPNCDQEDTTNVELEDYHTEYFVVTECVSCAQPYVIGITIRVDFRSGRVEMENSNA